MGLINKILLKINLYIQEVSSLSYLVFDCSCVKKREKKNSLDRKHKIIFCNTLSIRKLWETEAPLILQKEIRRSTKYHCTKNHISQVLEYHGKFKNTKKLSTSDQLFRSKKDRISYL